MTLEPGSYIILPRTSGCLFNHKNNITTKETHLGAKLFEKNEKAVGAAKFSMTPNFESTVEDIFMKYDLNNTKLLQFPEFKGFCECIGKGGESIKEEFKHEIVKKCQSVDNGESSEEKGLTR
jgi:hypothetical protein